MTSFDLRDRPWIPVVDGREVRPVGLRELFHRAHEFTDLAVPVPPAASGLWRVLYAVTARIAGLDRPGGWEQGQASVFEAGRFPAEAVDAYLDRYPDRFDLFHPQRPWLQDPRLRQQCPKPSGVNKLVFDRPAGNTQVWFGHHHDADPVPVDAAEAAWYLLAQLYYGASGRCSSRAVGTQRSADTKAGPLRSAMSYHPIGPNLFQSLIAGVPQPSGIPETADLCPWERDDLPDPLGVPYPRAGVCWLLTGRFEHAVLLVPGPDDTVVDAYLTWAWRLVSPPAVDPYVVQRRSKEGRWYQHPADGSRALWRDVDALLADQEDARRRPAIMTSAAGVDPAGALRIRAYGFDQDGQAKDRQWFTAITPPVVRWLEERDEDAAYGIRAVHATAEAVGQRLAFVLRAAWRERVGVTGGKRPPEGPWAGAAEAYYWPRAETVFWQHVEARDYTTSARDFHRLAHKAIDHAAGAQARLPRVARLIAAAHLGMTRKRPEGNAA